MPTLLYVLLTVLEIFFIGRAILRPHRQPSSRVAWVVVIAVFPLLGIIAYLLFGETDIGSKLRSRRKQAAEDVLRLIKSIPRDEALQPTEIPERYLPLFQYGQSVSMLPAVAGNVARMMADSKATIDSMVADIDAATDHVHVLFYIWLTDHSGLRVVEAIKRAAGRGVTCRAMVDGLGSRAMIRSEHWSAMRAAGVKVAVAMPLGNPLLRPFNGRLDLRNHRKIVVIDDHLTYCGSQNCADAEFLVKAKFAPWVDMVMRFEGPIARENQCLFVHDWASGTGEDVNELVTRPLRLMEGGFPAQVIGTGPTARPAAMPETFETLIFAARRELVITTPYYVPDEALQGAICAAAHRGVDTTLILPARNDSWIVGASSRSYYLELLDAGVKIHEYVGGLLHTKSLCLDGEVSLIGSANMDRRSFELNYENNILLYDPETTALIRRRQDEYLAQSRPVSLEDVVAWPMHQRLWNNAIGMLAPLL